MVEIRQEAQWLAVAITTALNLLIQDSQDNECLRWEPECSVSSSLLEDLEYNANIRNYIFPSWIKKKTISRTCNVYLDLSCDPEDNQWKFDNNMGLESLLGLWAWSLMCEPEVEKKDELISLIQSRALEVPVRRIVLIPAVEVLKEKLPRNSFNFKEHTFGSSATQPEPGNLWEEVGSNYRPLQGRLKGDLVQQYVFRIFGGRIDGRSDSPNLERDSGTVKMFTAHTSSTLVSSCAHEVFASFLASVLDKIPGARLETGPRGLLTRSLVDSLVKAFTDSQLGSAEEAMLCVLPPIFHKLGEGSS
ncbi:unnamed protein product [Clonostachys chloroleuca]|uniref:Uncharacterized protein n=1 Tax=Clonostachys chloroleuca TaxID=1926264 RepID=A0AA35Q626_9HYPO|nr:unnamed protein product [Clonostachys chloroleuca]